MKKIASIAASVALALSFNFSAVTAASANPDTGIRDVVDLCKSLVESGSFDSVGACMGSINKQYPTLCNDPAIQALVGAKNKGTCVAAIRHLLNDLDLD